MFVWKVSVKYPGSCRDWWLNRNGARVPSWHPSKASARRTGKAVCQGLGRRPNYSKLEVPKIPLRRLLCWALNYGADAMTHGVEE